MKELSPRLLRARAFRYRQLAAICDSPYADRYLDLADLLEKEADSWERTFVLDQQVPGGPC